MDRPTIYSGEVPRTVDILQGEQNTMVALGCLAQDMIGTFSSGGFVTGLTCTPGAGLTVSISLGHIYQLAGLEATTWSALNADTSDQIVKQGIALAAQTISLTPPSTGGFSQVFMIEAQYADLDTGSTVLPYYNAANPAAPFSGPGNSGTPQNTARKGTVLLQVKAGIAATTGTQVAPTVDSGFIALWLVTLANGAVSISGGNIVQVANAPFIGSAYMPKLANMPGYIQSGAWGYCVDTGAASAITVAPVPPPASIVAGTKLSVKILNAVTGATTMAVTLANGSVNTSPVVHGDLTALLANDLVASQVVELNFDGANWQMPRASASVAANQITASAVGLNAPINCSISATAPGAGILVVTVNGANGSALSVGNPLVATFRSATIGSGVPVTRIVTASPTFTVNSGNTLGTASLVASRFRVVLIDNAGTVLVGLINCLNPTTAQIFALNESGLNSTGTGTGGGSTAGVIYTSVASLSGLAIREIGFLEWSTPLTTAGTYNNAPNEIQLAGPGYKRAGDLIQSPRNVTGASATGTTVTSQADSVPTSAQGTQFMSQAITPVSPANVLEIEHVGHYSESATAAELIAMLLQDANATSLASVVSALVNQTNNCMQIRLRHEMVSGTASSTTFKINAGSTGAGTVTFNGITSARILGGNIVSLLEVREYAA